jgi:hypothetical protein
LIGRGLGIAAIVCAVFAPAAQAGWLPPVSISEAGEHVGGPHVVLDSEGNATAVWDRWNGTDTVVETAYRPAGEEWGSPMDLSEPEFGGELVAGANDAGSPQIAVDGKGDVTVVWERYGWPTMTLQSVDRPAGGSWTSPADIAEMPLASAPEPWIAVDEAGNAFAVWKQGEVIRSAFRPVGDAWEAPEPISSDESYVPKAAVDAAGDATAVWMHYDGGDYVVESAYRPAGGNWESPTLVSEPGESAGNPHVAIDAAGVTLVVWRGEDSGEEFVRAAERPAGDAWTAPADVSSPGERVESLRDAVDPDGNAIAVWSGDTGASGGYGIARAAYRPVGGAWETPTELSADVGSSYPSDVVFDSSGNAAVVWQRWDGVTNLVQASYRPAGGAWESSVDLSAEGELGMDSVVVLDAPGDATAADGDATAIWVDGEHVPCGDIEPPCYSYEVQAAGYDPDGAPAVEVQAALTGFVGEPIEISTPTGGLYSPLIEFGDGGTVAATQASHVYDEEGEYEVTVGGAEELGYRSSASRTITIGPAGSGPDPGSPEPGPDPEPGPGPDSGPGPGSGGPGETPVTQVAPVADAPLPSTRCVIAEAARDSALRRLRAIDAKLKRAAGGSAARRLSAAKRRQAMALGAARRRVADTC